MSKSYFFTKKKHAINTFILCFYVLLITACANFKQNEHAVTNIPEKFSIYPDISGTNTSQDLSEWWLNFNDPTLSKLIVDTLKNNPNLKDAQANLNAVIAQEKVSRSALWPTITSSASAGSSGTSGQSQDSYNAGLQVSWLADLFGQNSSAYEAAQADRKAALNNLYVVQTALLAETAQTYFNLQGQLVQLKIAQDTRDSQKNTCQLIEWQVKVGVKNTLELEQAKTVLAQSESSIVQLQTTLENTRHHLAVLTGHTPEEEKITRVAVTPTDFPAFKLKSIPAETLRQRPDIRMAENNLQAAIARKNESRAQLFPSLTLSGNIGLDSGKLLDLFSGATISKGILASLSATLFDAGRLRQQLAISSAQEEQAFYTYQSKILSALEEVENSLVTIVKLQEQEKHIQNEVKSAHLAAQLAQVQYRSGLIDYQTVLETQRSQLSAENVNSQWQTNKFLALVTLYQALGGGWKNEEDRKQ